jgi:hypothetical protein
MCRLHPVVLKVFWVACTRLENYTLTYYPGVPDPNSATALDIPPGADVRGIDFLLSVQQTYRVRGRLVDSATGLPPQRANVTVKFQNPALQGLGRSLVMRTTSQPTEPSSSKTSVLALT